MLGPSVDVPTTKSISLHTLSFQQHQHAQYNQQDPKSSPITSSDQYYKSTLPATRYRSDLPEVEENQGPSGTQHPSSMDFHASTIPLSYTTNHAEQFQSTHDLIHSTSGSGLTQSDGQDMSNVLATIKPGQQPIIQPSSFSGGAGAGEATLDHAGHDSPTVRGKELEEDAEDSEPEQSDDDYRCGTRHETEKACFHCVRVQKSLQAANSRPERPTKKQRRAGSSRPSSQKQPLSIDTSVSGTASPATPTQQPLSSPVITRTGQSIVNNNVVTTTGTVVSAPPPPSGAASGHQTPTPTKVTKKPFIPSAVSDDDPLKNIKGLRHFSKMVADKVEAKGETTYNEVSRSVVQNCFRMPMMIYILSYCVIFLNFCDDMFET